MTYKQKINKMIIKAGRTRTWLYKNAGISQPTFWRKMQKNSFTDAERNKIETLLSK